MDALLNPEKTRQPVQLGDLQPALPALLLDVRQTAAFLNVSDSWVRRHVAELPAVRIGRLVRFDSVLLKNQYSGNVSMGGKSLGKASMVNQRRYQDGSIQKRGKVWYGVFRIDIMDADGNLKRKQKRIRLGSVSDLPTKHAARHELQKHTMASKPTTEMTLSELVTRWQAAVVPTLKHSTANFYTRSLNSRILPTLGKTPVTKLGRYEIEMFLAAKSKDYARNTLREFRSSLSRVLSWAAANSWIEKNPVQGIKLPHGNGKKITRTVLTSEQVKAIASKLPEPYATLILFLAVTGLRVGEAVGIQWDDFRNGVLHVQRRIYEGKADTLKTAKSKRSLPMPESLMARLETLGRKGQWVFISENGTPVNYNNALKRYIRPVTRKLGIPLGGWHDLRHTLATDLTQSGVPTKTVSSILGHANVGITLDVYTHANPESFKGPLDERAAQLVM
jgi:integrase